MRGVIHYDSYTHLVVGEGMAPTGSSGKLTPTRRRDHKVPHGLTGHFLAGGRPAEKRVPDWVLFNVPNHPLRARACVPLLCIYYTNTGEYPTASSS